MACLAAVISLDKSVGACRPRDSSRETPFHGIDRRESPSDCLQSPGGSADGIGGDKPPFRRLPQEIVPLHFPVGSPDYTQIIEVLARAAVQRAPAFEEYSFRGAPTMVIARSSATDKGRRGSRERNRSVAFPGA